MHAIKRHLVPTRFGQIHCRDTGGRTGLPAVVLMHINQQSSALYLELMAAIAPQARAVAIDYPSHGMSDHIGFQPSIGNYAECVIAVMDGPGIDHALAGPQAASAPPWPRGRSPTATPSWSEAAVRTAANKLIYRNLPYDPERDFTPLSLVVEAPLMLMAHPALPVTSVPELIA